MQDALRKSKISVLLPDTLLENEDTLMLKTSKMGIIARIVTMHRIGEVLFYNDAGSEKDRAFLQDICRYIIYPPYLRKYLHPSKNLKYVAILPPIHSPNHLGIKYNNKTFVSGIVLNKNDNKIQVDVGKRKITDLYSTGSFKQGDLVIIANQNNTPSILSDPPTILYWVTEYKILNDSLENYLQLHNDAYIIAASKSGEIVTQELLSELQTHDYPQYYLAIGPLKGSFKKYVKTENQIHLWINVVPMQGTKTIKIEEALHSALALLNLASLNFI